MERKKKKLRWKDQPLATKVLCQVAMVAVILFSTNLLMYFQVNRTMHTLDTVYASNVNITELADSLDNVQTSMYNYLTVKTSNSLEDYYLSEDVYNKLFENLNDQVTENPVKLLERNIRRMSETYLEETAETVGAKRGRNVEKYKTSYEECLKMYRYLNSYIADLNGQQFKNNSASYQTLQQSIWFLEAVSSIMLILTMGVCILVLYYMVKNVSAPLRALAATAKLVGQANFNVKMPPTDAQDEVGVLTRAFNTMVASLEEYVKLTKENMEKEQKMVERELLMETHLKEAQLRYLQSQINPHSIILALVIGAWQAFWIAYVRIPPFIVTLAGMLMFRGLSNVVLNGKTLPIKSEMFVKLFGGGANCYIPDFLGGSEGMNRVALAVGILASLIYVLVTIRGYMNRKKNGYETGSAAAMYAKMAIIVVVIMAVCIKLAQYKGIPTSLVWVLLVVLVYGYITSKTTVGRHFYAVGGNEKATKLSGINTNRVYFIAYTNMGFLAGLAGLLTVARMTSAQPTYGQNYEMDAIGSCFIGGASAYGGTGTVPGVIVGAVLMGIINQGMSIMGTDQNMQKVVKGLVLLAAVIFDDVSKRKSFIAK